MARPSPHIASSADEPSTASPPAHWSPQQQTARMLALCEAQMDAATQDSDTAVETLAQSFTELVNTARQLSTLSKETDGNIAPRIAEVQQHCDLLAQQVAAAIVAFQFYDKLSQRLGHVRYSLSTLALFICDPPNSQKPEHWEKLLATLGRLYRTTEERSVFDAVSGSLSLSNNPAPNDSTRSHSAGGSVELF